MQAFLISAALGLAARVVAVLVGLVIFHRFLADFFENVPL